MTTHLRNAAAAAGSQDRAGATREIDAFAADVAQQKAAGHLSQADYTALQTGIGRTRTRIAAELPAAAAVVSPPATPATVAPATAAPSAPVQQIVVQGNGDGKVKIGGDGGRAKGDGKANGGGGNGNGNGDGGG